MKKLLLLFVVAICTATSYAQSSVYGSGLYLDGSVGFMKVKAGGGSERSRDRGSEAIQFMKVKAGGGSADLDGIALDLGIGYRQTLNEYLAWNMLKFNVMASLSDFSETITPQLKTGLRGTTPEFSNMSAYADANFGIGYQIDTEKAGFAYDLGIGLNITPQIAVGFNFNSQRVSIHGWSYKLNFYGAKVSYSF